MNQTVVDGLMEDLCKNPDDWKLRNILADYYQDTDKPEEAACIYWMLENKKRPYTGTGTATWFNATTISPSLGDEESNLPEDIYKNLEGGKETANHRSYNTILESEEAFIKAKLKGLRQSHNE